eukprot:m.111465 g.111465  ORF g.111465 m.111465 type:complete len:245 (-) comp10752_c0_seq2:78-812(-)
MWRSVNYPASARFRPDGCALASDTQAKTARYDSGGNYGEWPCVDLPALDVRGRNITQIALGGMSCWNFRRYENSSLGTDVRGILLDHNPLGVLPNASDIFAPGADQVEHMSCVNCSITSLGFVDYTGFWNWGMPAHATVSFSLNVSGNAITSLPPALNNVSLFNYSFLLDVSSNRITGNMPIRFFKYDYAPTDVYFLARNNNLTGVTEGCFRPDGGIVCNGSLLSFSGFFLYVSISDVRLIDFA